MSKIEQHILEQTGEKPQKRGESRDDYLDRLIKGVTDLDDKGWDAFDTGMPAAADWYNDAVDMKNAKKDAPDFPDAEEPPAEEKPAGRRRSTAKEETKSPLAVGVTATVTTKRDKIATGVVVELDDEVIVLDVDGKDKEFDRSLLKEITVHHGEVPAEDEPETPAEPKVGDQVEVINKRDKVFKGELVEIDEDIVVVVVDGKEEEIGRERVKSIRVIGADKPAAAAAEEPPASRRRGGGAEKAAPKEDAGADKKRSSNPAGVSVGQRIRELMAEDLAITEAEVGKVLKKEGIEFREPTLKMIFKDTTTVFDLLKANKKLK